MPINLSKGQKVDLTKGNPGLKNIMVGLGWDVNAFDTGADFDLDAAAFMCGSNGKCPTEKEFIFYGNLEHPTGCVKHMGDNLTGSGEGDDEQIMVDLTQVPSDIERIAFTVTIYDADVRRQNFGQVSNAFIRIVDVQAQRRMEIQRHRQRIPGRSGSTVRTLWNRSRISKRKSQQCLKTWKRGHDYVYQFTERTESESVQREKGVIQSRSRTWMG